MGYTRLKDYYLPLGLWGLGLALFLLGAFWVDADFSLSFALALFVVGIVVLGLLGMFACFITTQLLGPDFSPRSRTFLKLTGIFALTIGIFHPLTLILPVLLDYFLVLAVVFGGLLWLLFDIDVYETAAFILVYLFILGGIVSFMISALTHFYY